MDLGALALLVLAVQAPVAVLDLLELRRQARQPGARPPRPAVLAFLAAVLVVYAVLHLAGLALGPSWDGLAATLGAPAGGGERPLLLRVALGALVFYLASFWDYLLHRFVLHGRCLWFTHESHHLPRRVSALMPGVAARPYVVLASAPVILATLASAALLLSPLGAPLPDVADLGAVLVAQGAIGAISHSCALRRHAGVHRVLSVLALTTPQEHVLHHASDRAGNFGNASTLWDRLFGTYLDPRATCHRDVPLGLPYDQDFLGALTAGRVKLSPALRRRFEVGRYCNVEEPRA